MLALLIIIVKRPALNHSWHIFRGTWSREACEEELIEALVIPLASSSHGVAVNVIAAFPRGQCFQCWMFQAIGVVDMGDGRP